MPRMLLCFVADSIISLWYKKKVPDVFECRNFRTNLRSNFARALQQVVQQKTGGPQKLLHQSEQRKNGLQETLHHLKEMLRHIPTLQNVQS